MLSRRLIAIILVCWLVLLGVGFAVDLPVARWVAHHPLYDKRDWLVAVVKLPGNFLFTLAVAVALVLCHPRGRQAAVVLVGSAALGGLFYSVIKWIAGRPRPGKVPAPFIWHPFLLGFKGLWQSNGLGFPSGHACLSFATAAALGAFLPRWRPALFAAAAVVAAERVLENAHYVSDVIAGAGFGLLAAWCALLLANRWPVRRISASHGGRAVPVSGDPGIQRAGDH